MVSVYRKIMTMQIKNGLCLLWLFVLMLLFALALIGRRVMSRGIKILMNLWPVTNLSCRVILIR